MHLLRDAIEVRLAEWPVPRALQTHAAEAGVNARLAALHAPQVVLACAARGREMGGRGGSG